MQEEQSTTSRTPAAFSATTLKLKPGESKTVTLILGHAPDLDTFTSDIMPKLRTQGYVSTKMAEIAAFPKWTLGLKYFRFGTAARQVVERTAVNALAARRSAGTSSCWPLLLRPLLLAPPSRSLAPKPTLAR